MRDGVAALVCLDWGFRISFTTGQTLKRSFRNHGLQCIDMKVIEPNVEVGQGQTVEQ